MGWMGVLCCEVVNRLGFFCKQKTAYELRMSDWRSDVCSSDLIRHRSVRPISAKHAQASRFLQQSRPEEAADHLRRMAGTRHRLFSAAVAAQGGVPVWRAIGEAKLWMRPLSDAFIADYVAREWDSIRRSEEHTSELQSLMRISYAVFCLKKKK